MQLVIFVHLNELPFVFGLTKIIQPLPHEILILWGNVRPQRTQDEVGVVNPNHLILTAPHPSPLSAYRGFFDCGHFKKANDFLREKGLSQIDWQIENVN